MPRLYHDRAKVLGRAMPSLRAPIKEQLLSYRLEVERH